MPHACQISICQRLENYRKLARLEQERVRLDADKLQREKAKLTTSVLLLGAFSIATNSAIGRLQNTYFAVRLIRVS